MPDKETKIVNFPSVVPVKVIAQELETGAGEVIKVLMNNGVLATINESVDFDTAAIVAHELGFEAQEIKNVEEESIQEDDFKEYKSVPRPPVVTIMGHVDHGKTKLLDSIRNTNIIDTESGGITQHIGAYQTKVEILEDGKKTQRQITFLDTPGHEAFSAMRAYGANITDIVILVVAADEGVKPQTVEAISHAKAAKVPIIVAINKIDKPEADPDRVKRELSEHKIIPEEWGGKTPMIPLSAKSGEGIDKLLEVIALTADIEGLQAPIDKPGSGMVIESKVQPGKGPVASVIIREGTIRTGDFLVCGNDYAKIRFMEDWRGNRIKEGLPSDPILIAGFKKVPKSGSFVRVVSTEKIAKEISERLEKKDSIKSIAKTIGLGEISQDAKDGKIKELALIIKADVKGSLDAIRGSLEDITSEDIKINIVSDGVGAVTESDINLALASKAVILAFRVPIPPAVMKLSESSKVKISKYDIIYQLIDDVTAALEGMLEPEIIETKIGSFQVVKVFHKTKDRGIVGGRVIKGKITPGTRIDVIRNEENIGTIKPESIQLGQQKVNSVEAKDECGISYIGDLKLKQDDILEFILVEEHLKSLKKRS